MLIGATIPKATEYFATDQIVDGLDSLSLKIGVNLGWTPIYAALLLMICYGDQEDKEMLVRTAKDDKHPLAMIVSLLDSERSGASLPPVDLGLELSPSSIAVLVLRLICLWPRPELIRYAASLANLRPSLLIGLPILQGEFGTTLVKSVPDLDFVLAIRAATTQPRAAGSFDSTCEANS